MPNNLEFEICTIEDAYKILPEVIREFYDQIGDETIEIGQGTGEDNLAALHNIWMN